MMIEAQKIDERTISIAGKFVRFEQRIREILPLVDRVLVRFDILDYRYGNKMVGRNIVAYGENGEELWRVADHGISVPSDPNRPEGFVGVRLDDKTGRLIGITGSWILDIDPATGAVSHPRYRGKDG